MIVQRLNFPVDPAAAFRSFASESDYAFWLDSARGSSPMSRFSYVGFVPADSEVLRVEHSGVGESDNAWQLLATALETAPSVVEVPASLGFLRDELLGGYVGYFGYEARRSLGFSVPFEAATPDALWMPAVSYLIFDHSSGQTYAVGSEEWVASIEQELPRVNYSTEELKLQKVLDFPQPERAPYEAKVRESLREIFEGNSYEVCLTAETSCEVPEACNDEHMLALYLSQRAHNAAPYAALLKCGDHWVLSSSPEKFLTVSATGVAETKPIKGTVPRSADPALDEERAAWLASDPKTQAENLMIVDLLRNDLSRVSVPGSIRVPVLMGVESYSTVHQLVSTVTSQLRPGTTAVEAAAACFPGGSMTGAPKQSTMEIIDRLESRARGIYSGALGFFSATGAANLSIVIRTLVTRSSGCLTLSAGGAIVADSDPAAEYEEMLTKLAAAVPGLSA
ncbi:anthranilate synthase component I family protein [Rothia aerolata]|uniref:anthranilate synthase component I family protein n=1 Tax=Rothia aerolata TaxID=1812262 RepID=UPI001E36245E|nr:anthranilate synthase component I family protein [Rothia aerolata]